MARSPTWRCRPSPPICNTSPANSIWVVNAYQLAVTISLLPLASLGDIFGYRRVYQWGLVVFTLASLRLRAVVFAADAGAGAGRSRASAPPAS